MQVVLTEDLPNVGRSGELVRVRPGYARNFLVPRGLAAMATKDNVARVEHEQRVATARTAKQRSAAEALAAELGQVKLTIARTVGEGQKLYGSVSSRDVAEALAGLGHEIDRRKIELDPIKELGSFEARIRLGTGVDATVKVEVVAEE
ncbi:MAG: 50S ribosomal protein L9 [Deltaproteobacteria bacterium]|nr:50S ribosomal protein L9 [Deltaproteobacteria bacterium]